MTKKRTTWIRGDADVAKAVALTAHVAREAGLDTRRVSAVSTAASEICRNIVKYAGSGQFTVTAVEDGGRAGVRIEAHDRGPGIADVPAALRDHYSTGGTLGLGLPGVRRLMDELQVDSEAGRGTRVTATIWAAGSRPARRRAAPGPAVMRSPHVRSIGLPSSDYDTLTMIGAAARIRPHRNERVSGDDAAIFWVQELLVLVLLDGLGHGPAAAGIASHAIKAVEGLAEASAVQALESMHRALLKTDGAAGAVTIIDPRDGSYEAAAVGNVRVRTMGRSDSRIDWTEGTLGTHYRSPQPRLGRLGSDTLVMYTDGISDRFTRDGYAGVLGDDPTIAAREIVDRFGKDHDDASCIVARLVR